MIEEIATQTLLTYKVKLKQEILDLRKLACEKAEIVRTIEKAITDEDIEKLKEFLSLETAYSIKGIDHLIYHKEPKKIDGQ